MDIIWFVIGGSVGYLIGLGRKQNDIPKDLEKCNVESNQQKADIVYYKKLTKTLVEENTELRKKLNG